MDSTQRQDHHIHIKVILMFGLNGQGSLVWAAGTLSDISCEPSNNTMQHTSWYVLVKERERGQEGVSKISFDNVRHCSRTRKEEPAEPPQLPTSECQFDNELNVVELAELPQRSEQR